MPFFQKCELLLALFVMGSLTGCGTYVPQIQEIWDGKDAGGKLELNIKEQVYCELKRAVIDANNHSYNKDGQDVSLLPKLWGVQTTLLLQVDETSALNPGVAFNTPMHAGITNFVGQSLVATPTSFPFLSSPQSYSLGLGGTLSSQATRIDKFEFYYDVDKLEIPLGTHDRCFFDENGEPKTKGEQGSSLLLESDLGIDQWLQDALTAEAFYPSSPLTSNADPSFKQDVISYEVKFIVISSGNVTPTWKLVRISANQGSLPLASANRTRTHDLTITFGPSVKPGKGQPSEPSLIAANAHLASQIGLSVANNVRTVLLPSP